MQFEMLDSVSNDESLPDLILPDLNSSLFNASRQLVL